jgi:hypothetical protein
MAEPPRIPPPPTRYQAAAPAQRKAEPKARGGAVVIAPPATRFGPEQTSQPQLGPAGPAHNRGVPPPTRFGTAPPAQAKPTAIPLVRPSVVQRADDGNDADDESSDDDRRGLERLRRTHKRGLVGHGSRLGRKHRHTPYQTHEQTAKRWYDAGRNLPTEYIDTGFGQITISRGRAEKAGPMTNTNLKQYPGTTLGTKYSDIRSALNTGRGRLATAILTYLRTGSNPASGTFTANQIRAAAAIIGITHISEEARFPGAAKLARSLLKKIADGEMTFSQAFSEKWFPMVGSAKSLSVMLDDDDPGSIGPVMRDMSDSSDDDGPAPEKLGTLHTGGTRRSARLAK